MVLDASVWQQREDAPCLRAKAAREGLKGTRLTREALKRQAFRNYGSALGMAIMGTIIASATDLPGAAGVNEFVDAMRTAWYVGAGMLAVGWVVCQLFMPGGKQEGI